MTAKELEALAERLEAVLAEARRAAALAGKRLLSTEEAVALGYLPSARTAGRWRAAGEGPPWCEVGGLVRYRVEDLERWWESRRVLTLDDVRRRGAGAGAGGGAG